MFKWAIPSYLNMTTLQILRQSMNYCKKITLLQLDKLFRHMKGSKFLFVFYNISQIMF